MLTLASDASEWPRHSNPHINWSNPLVVVRQGLEPCTGRYQSIHKYYRRSTVGTRLHIYRRHISRKRLLPIDPCTGFWRTLHWPSHSFSMQRLLQAHATLEFSTRRLPLASRAVSRIMASYYPLTIAISITLLIPSVYSLRRICTWSLTWTSGQFVNYE